MKTVPEMLREGADTYEQRNKLYGDNYKTFGAIMVGFFPDGLTVRTQEEWNRLALFIANAGKLQRYAEMYNRGGHDDSLLDQSVYANMLRELDEIYRNEKEKIGTPSKDWLAEAGEKKDDWPVTAGFEFAKNKRPIGATPEGAEWASEAERKEWEDWDALQRERADIEREQAEAGKASF